MSGRIYLAEAMVTPLKCVIENGVILDQPYAYQSLEQLWSYSTAAKLLIFILLGRIHVLRGDDVMFDEGTIVVDDYLVFDDLDAAVAAALLEGSRS